MADFEKAYKRTMKNEGGAFGYSNNPKDPGGETIMGISRINWPQWAGWTFVDQAKQGSTFPFNLGYYTEIPRLVRLFYKQYFWDIMNLDKLENQLAAEKIFDTGVNVGVKVVIRFIQRTLNAANRKGTLWPDIPFDGIFGPATTAAIIACEKSGRINGFLAGIKVMQGAHYFMLMEKNQDLEEFYLGWLTRAME